MNWDQIERKWAEMANRMRADVRVPGKNDRSATAPNMGSGKPQLAGSAHAESAHAADQVTAK